MRRRNSLKKTDTQLHPGESLTEQCHKDEVKTQNILKKYALLGQYPTPATSPQFGDVSNLPDFSTAMNLIATVNASFSSLSADIRSQFKNDPETFFNFIVNPENREEIAALGISTDHLPAQAETPTPPPVQPSQMDNEDDPS